MSAKNILLVEGEEDKGNLLDEQAPLYVELIAWLHLVFKA